MAVRLLAAAVGGLLAVRRLAAAAAGGLLPIGLLAAVVWGLVALGGWRGSPESARPWGRTSAFVQKGAIHTAQGEVRFPPMRCESSPAKSCKMLTLLTFRLFLRLPACCPGGRCPRNCWSA